MESITQKHPIKLIFLIFLSLLSVYSTIVLLCPHKPLKLEFNLTTHTAQKITEKALLGRPTIIFFGFSGCSSICPIGLTNLEAVGKKMSALNQPINALFITIDPFHDTPATLKKFLSSFSQTILGATGSEDMLKKLQKTFTLYIKKIPLEEGDFTYDHTSHFFLFDQKNTYLRAFSIQTRPEKIIHVLRKDTP